IGTCKCEMFRQEKREIDCAKSFECVNKEDRIAPPLSENAEHIRCSDIPASHSADIDSRNASGKVPHWEGSKQVTETTNGERKKPHDDDDKLLRLRLYFPLSGPFPNDNLFFSNQMEMIERSVGVTPLTRLAFPIESGRVAASFCRVSSRKPPMSS